MPTFGMLLASLAEERKKAVPHELQELSEQRFLSLLTPHQRHLYRQFGRIWVRAQDGSYYELNCQKHHANIYSFDEWGVPLEKLCVYVAQDVPWCDNLIAQLLALQANLTVLRQTAVITERPRRL